MKRVFFLTAIILMFVSCDFNVSTANISDVKICTSVDNNSCTKDMKSIPASAKRIYASALLNNAPEGTIVTISWQYDNGEEWYEIDKVSLVSEGNSDVLSSNLSEPSKGWPSGNYRVVFTLNTDNSEPVIKTFSI